MGRVTEYIEFMKDKRKKPKTPISKDDRRFTHLTLTKSHELERYEFWHFAKDTKTEKNVQNRQKTNKKG
tara:strand:- start:66 stop:272 length:207 start_codon:yes stop_codon:yes gene_type:complete